MPTFIRSRLSAFALLIGPYSPDLADLIRKTAGISEPTCNAVVSPLTVFCCLPTPYHKIGADHARTELKSGFLAEFAAGIIRAEFPNLLRCGLLQLYLVFQDLVV